METCSEILCTDKAVSYCSKCRKPICKYHIRSYGLCPYCESKKWEKEDEERRKEEENRRNTIDDCNIS